MPNKDFELGSYFDGTVYLLEKRVPLKFSINHTNRKLVETADYIISGVTRAFGGAKTACDYAKRLYKTVFYVVEDLTWNDCDWAVQEWEKQMQDEEFRKRYEEEAARSYEKTKSVEAQIAKRAQKHKNKKEHPHHDC